MRAALLAFVLASLVIATAKAGTPLPSLPVQSLDGKPLQLPAALPPCPVLLIIGFTRASGTQTSAWSRRLGRDGSCATGLVVYQLAVTEDIPGMFRGMAVRGIRNSVPVALHPRFLLIDKDAARWRELVHYEGEDDAYLLLLDADHSVSWRHAGPLQAPAERALRTAIAAVNAP